MNKYVTEVSEEDGDVHAGVDTCNSTAKQHHRHRPKLLCQWASDNGYQFLPRLLMTGIMAPVPTGYHERCVESYVKKIDQLREADGALRWESLKAEFSRWGYIVASINSGWFQYLLLGFCRKMIVFACHSTAFWKAKS